MLNHSTTNFFPWFILIVTKWAHAWLCSLKSLLLLLISFLMILTLSFWRHFFSFYVFLFSFPNLKGQPWSNGSCCRWSFSLSQIGQHSFWIGREHPRTRRRSFQRCRLLIKIHQELSGSIRINPMTHQSLKWGQKILADYCCMNLAGFFFFQEFLFKIILSSLW